MTWDARGRYRLRIIGLADGRPSPIAGAWVRDCDVNARGGRGTVIGTRMAHQALIFDSVGTAWAFWQRQSTAVPLRPDGGANRPLTAYTIEVEQVG